MLVLVIAAYVAWYEYQEPDLGKGKQKTNKIYGVGQ